MLACYLLFIKKVVTDIKTPYPGGTDGYINYPDEGNTIKNQ